MRGLRITLEQNMPSYRKPTSFVLKESFPLPSYSAVIGMVHAACDCKSGEYIDMQVSIQGSYHSAVSEQYTRYEFGSAYEKERHNIHIQANGKSYGITRGVGNIEVLTDVKLCIHLVPSTELDLERIAHGLRYPKNYLSLGRWEDIVNITEIKTVEIENKCLDNTIPTRMDAYLPKNSTLSKKRGVKGSIYTLNKKFTIKNGIRKWDEQVEVYHIATGTVLGRNDIMMDEDQIHVFLA